MKQQEEFWKIEENGFEWMKAQLIGINNKNIIEKKEFDLKQLLDLVSEAKRKGDKWSQGYRAGYNNALSVRPWCSDYGKGFMDGYDKAKELHKYTEQDIVKVVANLKNGDNPFKGVIKFNVPDFKDYEDYIRIKQFGENK